MNKNLLTVIACLLLVPACARRKNCQKTKPKHSHHCHKKSSSEIDAEKVDQK